MRWSSLKNIIVHDGEGFKLPAYHSLEGFKHIMVFQLFEVKLESCVFWLVDSFPATVEGNHLHFASSSSSPAKPSMSSAKRKLVIVLPPMLTVPSWSSKASVVILSIDILKRLGESRYFCRTPAVVRNQSSVLLLKRTALVALS